MQNDDNNVVRDFREHRNNSANVNYPIRHIVYDLHIVYQLHKFFRWVESNGEVQNRIRRPMVEIRYFI